jgi:hypothetical protein
VFPVEEGVRFDAKLVGEFALKKVQFKPPPFDMVTNSVQNRQRFSGFLGG